MIPTNRRRKKDALIKFEKKKENDIESDKVDLTRLIRKTRQRLEILMKRFDKLRKVKDRKASRGSKKVARTKDY